MILIIVKQYFLEQPRAFKYVRIAGCKCDGLGPDPKLKAENRLQWQG